MPPIKSAKGPEVKPLNEMPEIPIHPEVKPLCYWCWLTSTFVLVILLKVFLPWEGYGAMIALPISIGILGLWLAIFVVRLLVHILLRSNAREHAEAQRRVQRDWQARMQCKAALIQAVLVGAAGNGAADEQILFGPDNSSAKPRALPDWLSAQVGTVVGEDNNGRECQLALLLAKRLQTQQSGLASLRPLRCFWLGALESWQVFGEQMAKTCPDIELPACPEPWQGIDSLYAIIDQLQDAPDDARILCAGCHSSGPQNEGALLWLFAPQGRLLFSRGDWPGSTAGSADSIAVQAWHQSRQKIAPQICVSFSDPDLSLLSGSWLPKEQARVETLEHLPDMLAMTLAAWHEELLEKPSVWGPNPKHRSKVLGIIQSEGSSTSANSARTVAL